MEYHFSKDACDSYRKTLDGFDRSLDFKSDTFWSLDPVKDPTSFFNAIGAILPPGAVLCMEGCDIPFEVAQVYTTHLAINTAHIRRDTIWPPSELWHLRFSPALVADVIKLVHQHPREHLFFHIKAYSG